MSKFKKTFLTIAATFIFAAAFAFPVAEMTKVSAAENDNLLCQIFPFLEDIIFASGLCGDVDAQGGSALETAGDFVRFGVSLIFIGVIAVAIFVIIKAAIKYIRSEGDESKVEEATKAIKNVFIGIAALIIGVIGLVIILSLVNNADGGGILETEEPPAL